LTYNWLSMSLCVIQIEHTALFFSIYILQVPY
jgi:hypothetical protein